MNRVCFKVSGGMSVPKSYPPPPRAPLCDLLIGTSHKSRNNLEKDVSLKISLSSRVLHMFLLLDYNRLLSSTFSCCKSLFRFVPLFITTSVDNYTLRNETEQVPIM